MKILNVELSSLGSHKLSLSIQDFQHHIIMEASNKLKPVTELTCAQFSIGIFIVLFSFAGIFYIIGELTIHFPLYLAFLTLTSFLLAFSTVLLCFLLFLPGLFVDLKITIQVQTRRK